MKPQYSFPTHSAMIRRYCGERKILASQLNSGILNPSLTGFLNTRDATGNSSRPAAWLNIIVLDEQLNPVITSDGKNSYYEQVGPGNTSSVKQYTISGREITKNGYVYIYVSNETPNVNVYWDNLHCLSRHSGITQVRSALLQEEGYYPFGLEMKALSTQAAAVTTNKYKFNAGTELENSFDVSYYETYLRNYDAQVGRFTGVDAMAESTAGFTPYQFANNNPINFNDPRGATAYDYNNDHLREYGWDSRGGMFGAGGGIEYIFNQTIPIEFLTQIR